MRLAALLFALITFGSAALLLALFVAARRRAHDLARLDGLLDGADTAAPTETPQITLPEGLRRLLQQAGFDPSPRQLGAIALGVVLVALLALRFGGPLAAILALLAVAGLGWAGLIWRARRRMQALSDCMLGFLERIRQLLAVGNSLSVVLARATDNSPPIVTQCLASTIRRISNGSGTSESLERCAADLDIYELHLLATAARTNLRFGGSMTGVLRNIIDNIRRRSSIERELRADTTQIRASAWLLGLLPIVVASIVMFNNRGYAGWFLATHAGHLMLAYAALSQLTGAMLMRLVIRTRY